ncbi:putative EG45-like domain containing protein 1 [Gossypium hirsutum]|uniref:EG45-like domain containing protein 1 n=1 Tax=Gossypium hirsutum TaxID=3635 RepID=A0A1U8KX68_GOSHI|nr:putative EG45-like domain containing protein 1 [Gossypium hirsutum]
MEETLSPDDLLPGRVNQDGQPLRLLLGTAQGRLLMAIRTYLARAIKAMVVQMGTKLTSACFGNQDQGKMIASVGDALWGNRIVCGKIFTVTCMGPQNPVPHPCIGKSVTVNIIDHYPGCPSTIDLSQEAFTIIASLVAGVINVDYK